MKKLSYISLLIVILFSTAFAQNNSPCPKIEFTFPNYPIHPGDKMPFSLTLSDEAKNLHLEYKWTVSVETIIEGQGTTSINVPTTIELEGQKITATVEISGLPENCSNKFSETGIVANRIADPIVYEYEKADPSEDLQRIDITMTELANSSNAVGVFYLNFKTPTEKQINSRLNQIQKQFVYRHYPRDRIIFVITKGERNFTRIYIRLIEENEKFECFDCEILKIIKGSEIKFNK